VARGRTVAPARRAEGERAHEPGGSPAAEAAADDRRRKAVQYVEGAGQGPAAQFLRLLVRGLSWGVAGPEDVLREVPEQPERGVSARQHRRGHETAAALPERDEVPVPGRAPQRRRRAADDALR